MSANIKVKILDVMCNIFNDSQLFNILASDHDVFLLFVKSLGFLKYLEKNSLDKKLYYKDVAQIIADKLKKSFTLSDYESVASIDIESTINSLTLAYFNVYKIDRSILLKSCNHEEILNKVLKSNVILEPTSFSNPQQFDNPQQQMPFRPAMPAQPHLMMDELKKFYPYKTKPKIITKLRFWIGIIALLFIAFSIIPIAIAVFFPSLNHILIKSYASGTNFVWEFITFCVQGIAFAFFAHQCFNKNISDRQKYHVSVITLSLLLALIGYSIITISWLFIGPLFLTSTVFSIIIASFLAIALVLALAFVGVAIAIFSFNPKVDIEKQQELASRFNSGQFHPDNFNNQNPNNPKNFNNQNPNNFASNFNNSYSPGGVEHHDTKNYKKKVNSKESSNNNSAPTEPEKY